MTAINAETTSALTPLAAPSRAGTATQQATLPISSVSIGAVGAGERDRREHHEVADPTDPGARGRSQAAIMNSDTTR